MYVCMYVCTYVCTYVCMYVCMYVCTYVHVTVCTFLLPLETMPVAIIHILNNALYMQQLNGVLYASRISE